MKTQFKILLFLFCINVTAYAVLTATTTSGEYIFPGVQYSGAANATSDLDQFESEFNATDAASSWSATPFSGIPLVGDIFSGLNMLFSRIRFLVDGFGMTLEWIGSFIPVAQTAFTWIAYILRGVFAICAFTLVIELITGRELMA